MTPKEKFYYQEHKPNDDYEFFRYAVKLDDLDSLYKNNIAYFWNREIN